MEDGGRAPRPAHEAFWPIALKFGARRSRRRAPGFNWSRARPQFLSAHWSFSSRAAVNAPPAHSAIHPRLRSRLRKDPWTRPNPHLTPLDRPAPSSDRTGSPIPHRTHTLTLNLRSLPNPSTHTTSIVRGRRQEAIHPGRRGGIGRGGGTERAGASFAGAAAAAAGHGSSRMLVACGLFFCRP